MSINLAKSITIDGITITPSTTGRGYIVELNSEQFLFVPSMAYATQVGLPVGTYTMEDAAIVAIHISDELADEWAIWGTFAEAESDFRETISMNEDYLNGK